MFRILIKYRGEVHSEHRVKDDEIIIGSGDESDVQLDAGLGVARRHARIFKDEEKGWMMSPNSGQKVVSRGEPLKENHQLVAGHTFLIGEYVMTWDDVTEMTPGEGDLHNPTLPAAENPRIRVITGADAGLTVDLNWDLAEKPATIGRADDNDVVLSDRSVSRHHATIKEEEEAFVIRDEGSSYGLKVQETSGNDEYRLYNGITFELGDNRILFECPLQGIPGEVPYNLGAPLETHPGVGFENDDPHKTPVDDGAFEEMLSIGQRGKNTPQKADEASGSRMNPALWPLMIGAILIVAGLLIVAIIMYNMGMLTTGP